MAHSPLERALVAACDHTEFAPEAAIRALEPFAENPRVRRLLGVLLLRTKSSAWYVERARRAVVEPFGAASAAADQALDGLFDRLERRLELAPVEVLALERGMLDDIRRAPHDPAPRAVYADWLMARGDPHGELISLQLAGGGKEEAIRREHALLTRYGRAWRGSMPGVDHVVFRRGFPTTGFTVAHGPFMSASLWSIEELELGRPLIEPLSAGVFPNLCKLGPLSLSELEANVAHDGAPRPHHLALAMRGESSIAARLGRALWGPKAAAVVRLDLLPREGVGVAMDILRALPRIRQVGIECVAADVPHWVRWFEGQFLGALHLGLGVTWPHSARTSVDLELRRADRGLVARLASRSDENHDLHETRAWLSELGALVPVEATSVELVNDKRYTPAALAEIERRAVIVYRRPQKPVTVA